MLNSMFTCGPDTVKNSILGVADLGFYAVTTALHDLENNIIISITVPMEWD
jgi:hypothetical protein